MKTRVLNSHHHQRGASLIEIMIALLIGIILTSGAVSIFISNNAAANLASQLSRMQENGRFLIEILSKEIRMAGYTGCSSRGNITPNVITKSPPLLTFGNENAVRGFDTGIGGWAPYPPIEFLSIITLDPVTSLSNIGDSDILSIQRLDECSINLIGLSTSSPLRVPYPHDCDFNQRKPLTVSNCEGMELFQPRLIDYNSTSDVQRLRYDGGPNNNLDFRRNYDTNASVAVPHANFFYVGDNNDGGRSLYMASWDPDGDANIEKTDYQFYELAKGVQRMEILYGEDTGGDEYIDRYVTADAVSNWTRVRSVRIDLLLQSADNTTAEARPFMFNGANANTANDKRLRLAFSTTISLRNRLP